MYGITAPPIPRPVTGLQQLENFPFHLLGGVIAREILSQGLRFDADLLFLVGLFLGENGVQFLRRQPALAGELLQADGLRQRRRGVLSSDQIPQFRLLVSCEVRQFHGGRKGDAAIVHHLKQRRDEVGQADVTFYLCLTVIRIFTNLTRC